jgi:hypothetical protein
LLLLDFQSAHHSCLAWCYFSLFSLRSSGMMSQEASLLRSRARLNATFGGARPSGRAGAATLRLRAVGGGRAAFGGRVGHAVDDPVEIDDIAV